MLHPSITVLFSFPVTFNMERLVDDRTPRGSPAQNVIVDAANNGNADTDANTMMSNAKSRDTRAQAGELTNLCEFISDINLPTQELEPVIEKGELKFRNKKVKRSIDSFSTWLSAWNNYELVLMAKHPNIYKKTGSLP